jgi:hypothetical protein
MGLAMDSASYPWRKSTGQTEKVERSNGYTVDLTPIINKGITLAILWHPPVSRNTTVADAYGH